MSPKAQPLGTHLSVYTHKRTFRARPGACCCGPATSPTRTQWAHAPSGHSTRDTDVHRRAVLHTHWTCCRPTRSQQVPEPLSTTCITYAALGFRPAHVLFSRSRPCKGIQPLRRPGAGAHTGLTRGTSAHAGTSRTPRSPRPPRSPGRRPGPLPHFLVTHTPKPNCPDRPAATRTCRYRSHLLGEACAQVPPRSERPLQSRALRRGSVSSHYSILHSTTHSTSHTRTHTLTPQAPSGVFPLPPSPGGGSPSK